MSVTKVQKVKRPGLSSCQKSVANTIPTKDAIGVGGVNNNPLLENTPKRLNTTSEKVISGQNNTHIVLGRDRLGPTWTGYGGKGHTGAGTVDIVAGAGSWMPKTGETIVNPNPTLDASRIYISQKTDVDENFKLAAGTVGNIKHKAAIAIKSDSVRIIGRDGIKLTTGTDVFSSRGNPLISVPAIELNAGNVEEVLDPAALQESPWMSEIQSIPKGQKLSYALSELADLVTQLNGIVDSFLLYQMEFNKKLATHRHPDVVAMGLGGLATGNPLALMDGKTMIDPPTATAGAKCSLGLLGISKKDLLTHKINLGAWKTQFLEFFSQDYINSRFNTTT